MQEVCERFKDVSHLYSECSKHFKPTIFEDREMFDLFINELRYQENIVVDTDGSDYIEISTPAYLNDKEPLRFPCLMLVAGRQVVRPTGYILYFNLFIYE